MDEDKKDNLPALREKTSASVLDENLQGIDELTLLKRKSAKDASHEAKKNEVRTSTQRRYESVHKLYRQFCDELKINYYHESEDRAAEAIHLFISCSIINKKIKPQTVSVYLAAMSNFFKCQNFRISPTKLSVLEDIKKSSMNITGHTSKSKAALEIHHALAMIEKCDISTLRGLMHRAILAFAFCSGCRRSEIASLHTASMKERVEYDGYEVSIKTKTTNKVKKVMSMGGIPLRTYIKEWKIASGIDHGYLFHKIDRYGKLVITEKSVHIHGQEIKNILKKYGQGIDANIDVSDIGGHSTRSGVATSLLRRGASIKSVQDLLGHERPEMTIHYHKIVDGWVDHAANVLNKKDK